VVYEADAGAAESVKDFFERNGGDWTVVDADEGRTSVDWGVAAVPESYLVAPSGIVVERFVGGVTQAGLNAVIDAFQNQEGP
jgi:cytochrome c biogenesis protein CcmG, thiol:disulfide interchange protein DsbE